MKNKRRHSRKQSIIKDSSRIIGSLQNSEAVLVRAKELNLELGVLECPGCKKIVPHAQFCLQCGSALLFVPPENPQPLCIASLNSE